jgi:hypothetical protein
MTSSTSWHPRLRILYTLAILIVSVVMIPPQASADLRTLGVGDNLFPTATNVTAEFEFNGNVQDSSGNDRHATLVGGSFTPTNCGTGLQVGTTLGEGISWNSHAGLLVHPFTVEMVLTPQATTDYAKLVGFDDTIDTGWYYRDQNILAYPDLTQVGQQTLLPGTRHYLAFVSTTPTTMTVYFQGTALGELPTQNTAPVNQALFFIDDSETAREEQLVAVVEALRISSVSRTAQEIAATQQHINTACSIVRIHLPNVTR